MLPPRSCCPPPHPAEPLPAFHHRLQQACPRPDGGQQCGAEASHSGQSCCGLLDLTWLDLHSFLGASDAHTTCAGESLCILYAPQLVVAGACRSFSPRLVLLCLPLTGELPLCCCRRSASAACPTNSLAWLLDRRAPWRACSWCSALRRRACPPASSTASPVGLSWAAAAMAELIILRIP